MHVTVEVVGEGRRSTTSPTTPPTPTSFARPATILRRRRRWSTARRFLATASSTPNRSGCSGLSRADRRAAAREREGDPSDSPDSPDNIEIGTASPDDRLDILRVLDAAMLETDAETVDAAIDAGDALVARFKRTDAVVGALVATRPESDRVHVDAVAVRRARRGRGSAPRSSPRRCGAPSATPRVRSSPPSSIRN